MNEQFAQKRNILSVEFISTKEHDETSHLLLYLKNLVLNSTIEGLPVILNFKISKTDKFKTYAGNILLNIQVPIIPASYNSKSNKELSEFVEKANSKDAIIEHNKTVNPKKLDAAVDDYAKDIFEYLQLMVAQKYSEAKQNNDEQIMKQLSSLEMMKDCNIDLVADILLTSKDENPIEYNQLLEPVSHFKKLSTIMKNYENFEIFKEKFEQKNAETRKNLIKAGKYPPQKGDEDQ